IKQVIDLTNAERKKQGLSPLKAMPSLSDVAQEKSRDIQQKNYFSHTSPTYGSPFDMMRDFGVDFNTAGENIAQGQQTPEAVVDAWM
ncbi:CAP domain-containing protein, partial [Micrococcus sp. SIMBA_144]